MKKVFLLLNYIFLGCTLWAQEKKTHAAYNKMIEIKGTDCIVLSTERTNKKGLGGKTQNSILFLNTKDGSFEEHLFKKEYHLNAIKVIGDDTTIHKKVMAVCGYKSENKHSNTLLEVYSQIYLFNPDGSQQQQLLPDQFVVKQYEVIDNSKRIVVLGYRDLNHNIEKNKDEPIEIIVYATENGKEIQRILSETQ